LDTVPATLSGEEVKAEVDRVSEPTLLGEERGEPQITSRRGCLH
jgi:hypothetical protein